MNKIVIHYAIEDKECDGDYISVDIIFNNKKVKSYGDAYHDHGLQKALAFVEGCEFITQNKIKIIRIDLPDIDI
jgi:hypothetical protein